MTSGYGKVSCNIDSNSDQLETSSNVAGSFCSVEGNPDVAQNNNADTSDHFSEVDNFENRPSGNLGSYASP